jgi:hypothetical protein
MFLSFLTTSVDEQGSCVPSYPQGNGSDSYFEVPTKNSRKDCFWDDFQILLPWIDWSGGMYLSSVSPGKLVRGVTLLRFLYSVGLLFESLSRYQFFLGFLSSSRHIPRCYRNSGHWCYLSCPSQFITHHRTIIWRYTISITDTVGFLFFYFIYFFLSVALRPNAGLLILEVSRSHTTTHHSR